MEQKYKLLEKVLDKIITESPRHLAPSLDNQEQIYQARGRALIHLYLRTSFGILEYENAERFITDGTHDGGLDAYYIDEENKRIYLIQSKYRTTKENFEDKAVDGYDLFKMELKRIVNGDEKSDVEGYRFNSKVISFQTKLKDIGNIGRYKFILVFIGNIPNNLAPDRLNQVTGQVCHEVEVINGDAVYMKLLLPFLQSDFYKQEEFVLKINVKQDQSNRIKYKVKVYDRNVNIDLCFIPTQEVARMMLMYKNSLLKYNPRCYTGIKKGGVNKKIESSISETESNEFSLLNNGITIICNNFEYSENNAIPDTATILVSNPQIVNGGQTAFTLAKLLESTSDKYVFDNKEVLVKFMSISDVEPASQLKLIEKISEATNTQTPVELSDRMSNDKLLVELQNHLFDNFGIMLERKKGEFYDSIQNKLIEQNNILEKDKLMRLLLCYQGKAAEARNSSGKKLFEVYPLQNLEVSEYKFIPILMELNRLLDGYEYEATSTGEFNLSNAIEVAKLELNLRYGKYSILTASFYAIKHNPGIQPAKALKFVMDNWEGFKTTITKKSENTKYIDDGFNFDNYYKGSTVNTDLKEYFFKRSLNLM